MKFLFFSSLVLLIMSVSILTFSGCKNTGNETDGPSGIAHYYIQNMSDHDLLVSFNKSSNLGGGLVENQTIQAHATLKIFEDNILGKNPKPSDSFKSLRLKKEVNNVLETLYTQNPIDNDQWPISEQNLGDNLIGFTKYTLIITNQDLVF